MTHRKPLAICLLALLGLVAGLLLLVMPTAPRGSAQGLPDLSINLYRSRNDLEPFAPGSEITYEIYWVNWSGNYANDASVTVTLPEHTTYISSSEPGFVLFQAGPTQLGWYRSDLSGFERGWLSYTVRVHDDAPVGAVVDNLAEIWTYDREPDDAYGNNLSLVQETVRPAVPDLQVTKHLWAHSPPIAAGSVISYEITTWNQGGAVASGVRLTDTLPANCTYIGDDPAGSGLTTSQTGQTVVWTQDALAPAQYQEGPHTVIVGCQVAADWTQEQWLENVVEISTTDEEYNDDNNLSRWVYKPEADRRYAAAVTRLDDRTFRQASEAGFDYLLFYLDWSQTELEDDEYDWNILDHAVWQAWRHNLRLVVRVDRAPEWTRGSSADATAPPGNPAKLGEFLEVASARWPRQAGDPDQPQVYGYVIWNEPNLAAEWGGNAPDAAAYAALLQAAYNGVKAGSADAWVISAGLATTGDDPPLAVDDRTFLQQLYDAGAAGTFDYLGANPMGFASAPDDASDPNGFNFARAESWREIMVANGDGGKDMFGAETGWLRDTDRDLGDRYNWMKVPAIDQAHYLGRAYHKARCDWQRGDGTPWMGPMTTWNLDFASGEYTEDDHPYWFGVTGDSRQPLRAYRTLQNAATLGPADLWLEKELVGPLLPGQDLHYEIRYTNIGGQTAAGVLMTDTLPVGAEYVLDTGGGMLTPGGDQVVWDLGNVDTCDYETITLTLRLPDDPAITELVNRAEISTVSGEPYTDDNVAEVTTALTDLLAIKKSVAPARVGPGGILTYTLAFSNTGEGLAGGVVISDIVPTQYLTGVAYTHSGADITPTGDVSYTWQVEDLSPDGGGLITITAMVKPGTKGTFSLTNRAVISATSTDFFWDNNRTQVSNTVDSDPPAMPELQSPANGATIADNTPTLTWQASPASLTKDASAGADVAGYLLQVNGVLYDVGDVTQHTTGILADGDYTWTVAAYDTVGNTSAYAAAWTFTVDAVPPEPPVLVSPADGSVTSDNTPTLTWQVSPSPDVAGYLLDLNGVVQDVGNVTQHTSDTLADGNHTWTVAAYDTGGKTSAYATAWTFTVDAVPPEPPALVSPADGSLTNDNTPELVWRASPSADVAGYLLKVDGVVQDVGNVTRQSTSALVDGDHTWTVGAYDTGGKTSAYAPAWAFAVDTVPPAPPILASPADGATIADNTPTFIWQASPSADVAGYLLDLDGNVQDVGKVTQFTSGRQDNGEHTWTVAAYDAAGNASSCAAWTFKIDAKAPKPPTLISPADGTRTEDSSILLTWWASPTALASDAASAAGYLLELDGKVRDVGKTTQRRTGDLADGTHTWRVAAYDRVGNLSRYTAAWTFTVDTTAPGVPVLTSPPDGARTTDRTVVLTWRGASSASPDGPSSDVAGYLLDFDGAVQDVGDVNQYTASPLAYGTFAWTVAAYDALGNTSAYASPWSFTVGPHRLYLPLLERR